MLTEGLFQLFKRGLHCAFQTVTETARCSTSLVLSSFWAHWWVDYISQPSLHLSGAKSLILNMVCLRAMDLVKQKGY